MGISQEELAEKVYVSRQTVSNWETGKNYPDMHGNLERSAFDIQINYLDAVSSVLSLMKQPDSATEGGGLLCTGTPGAYCPDVFQISSGIYVITT